MIESRCGILCSSCPYNAKNGGLKGSACTGCTNMDKPVWADSCPVKSCCEGKGLAFCGLCADFPCALLVDFANDKQHGDEGRRIEQCKKWAMAEKSCCSGRVQPLPYEVVELPAITVAGFSLRTSNTSPSMQADIGAMWGRFFSPGAYDAILGKKDGKYVGMYTNYESDHKGAYDFVACCAVSDVKQGTGIETKIIPAGKYAKFTLRGPMMETVGGFWQALWNMDLPRAYTCDFEEYQEGCTMEHSVIHMYISLKQEK